MATVATRGEEINMATPRPRPLRMISGMEEVTIPPLWAMMEAYTRGWEGTRGAMGFTVDVTEANAAMRYLADNFPDEFVIDDRRN